MEQAEKAELLAILTSRFNSGFDITKADILRTKMDWETAESQLRSAIASERNACQCRKCGHGRRDNERQSQFSDITDGREARVLRLLDSNNLDWPARNRGRTG
jgi:hypothetical protein